MSFKIEYQPKRTHKRYKPVVFDGSHRITKCHVSKALKYFENSFMNKYGLSKYGKVDEPFIKFGMYYSEDYRTVLYSQSPVIVVWCGNDAAKKSLKVRARRLLAHKKRIKHIATSECIAKDLRNVGLECEVIPVTPSEISFEPCKRGDKIYFYYCSEVKKDFYGYDIAKEVEKRTGIKIIYATADSFSSEQMKDVYSKCFMGLRLTPRDGVASTVIELGMMGRRSVFNGDSPSSLKWNTVDDVCRIVQEEYENRNDNDEEDVSRAVKEYLNDNKKWLMI